jgi:hypothetical protein
MTLKQFLHELRIVTAEDRTWCLEDGCITSVEDEQCPIHEVWLHSPLSRETGQLEDYYQEGEALGLSPHTISRIAAAADARGYPKMRAKLLKACGLEESDAHA